MSDKNISGRQLTKLNFLRRTSLTVKLSRCLLSSFRLSCRSSQDRLKTPTVSQAVLNQDNRQILTDPVALPPLNKNKMQEQPKRKNGSSATKRVLKQCAAMLLTFYAGFTFGYSQGSHQTSRYLRSTSSYEKEDVPEYDIVPINYGLNASETKIYTKQEMEDMVKRKVRLFTKLHNKGQKRAEEITGTGLAQSRRRTRQLANQKKQGSSIPEQLPVLPRRTKDFAAAMSVVDRSEFAQLFDTGVPLIESERAHSKVLLIHGKNAVPDNAPLTEVSAIDNVQDAVKNCNYVSLILTQPTRTDQCIAIMGQYNSYHVHKFMRVANDKPGKAVVDPNLPLRLVRRGTNTAQGFTTSTPSVKQTKRYWNSTLLEYFINLDSYLDELKPILKKVALCKTVIVMTCNKGQSDLLMNFVCNSKAKNLDMSGIVVFATDVETAELAEGLGLATYYNEQVRACDGNQGGTLA